MADDKIRHWRALADFLGKEMYVLAYDASSDCFRQLPPPGAGLGPVAAYRVLCDDEPGGTGDPLAVWPHQGASYRIYRVAIDPSTVGH